MEGRSLTSAAAILCAVNAAANLGFSAYMLLFVGVPGVVLLQRPDRGAGRAWRRTSVLSRAPRPGRPHRLADAADGRGLSSSPRSPPDRSRSSWTGGSRPSQAYGRLP